MNSDEFVRAWFKAQLAYLNADSEDAQCAIQAQIEYLYNKYKAGSIEYLHDVEPTCIADLIMTDVSGLVPELVAQELED